MTKTPHNAYSLERNYYKTKKQEKSVYKLLAKGYEVIFTEYKGNNLLYHLRKLSDNYKKIAIVNSNGAIYTNIFDKY